MSIVNDAILTQILSRLDALQASQQALQAKVCSDSSVPHRMPQAHLRFIVARRDPEPGIAASATRERIWHRESLAYFELASAGRGKRHPTVRVVAVAGEGRQRGGGQGHIR